jgi:hypothetical protein
MRPAARLGAAHEGIHFAFQQFPKELNAGHRAHYSGSALVHKQSEPNCLKLTDLGDVQKSPRIFATKRNDKSLNQGTLGRAILHGLTLRKYICLLNSG